MSTIDWQEGRPLPSVLHVRRWGEVRRYVPERTCRMTSDAASCLKTCSECGAAYGIFVQTPRGCKAPSYCPNCGARIIKEEP